MNYGLNKKFLTWNLKTTIKSCMSVLSYTIDIASYVLRIFLYSLLLTVTSLVLLTYQDYNYNLHTMFSELSKIEDIYIYQFIKVYFSIVICFLFLFRRFRRNENIALLTLENGTTTARNKEGITKESSDIIFTFNSVKNNIILFNDIVISKENNWIFIRINKFDDSKCIFYKDDKFIFLHEIASGKKIRMLTKKKH